MAEKSVELATQNRNSVTFRKGCVIDWISRHKLWLFLQKYSVIPYLEYEIRFSSVYLMDNEKIANPNGKFLSNFAYEYKIFMLSI